MDLEWIRAQTAFYFGQLTALVRKEGATRGEILDLVDEFADKIMTKVNDGHERTPSG